jgi:hypothetical protein
MVQLGGCGPSQTNDDSGVNQFHTPSGIDLTLQNLGDEARQDLRFVKFRKIDSKMHAFITRDLEGTDIETSLGLVSWAPGTKYLAKKGSIVSGGQYSLYNIHAVAKRSQTKKIYNFMAINDHYAIHSRYAGSHSPSTAPSAGDQKLRANGFLDPTGKGCIRIQDQDSNFGGHQSLYQLASSYQKKYLNNQFDGKFDAYQQVGIPIFLDLAPFAADDTQTTIAAETPPSEIEDPVASSLPTPPQGHLSCTDFSADGDHKNFHRCQDCTRRDRFYSEAQRLQSCGTQFDNYGS